MACVRLPRVGFSAEATHTPSLLQACGPHLSPCLTSVCEASKIPFHPTPVIMPGMSELHEESEASLPDTREAESPVEALII